MIADSLLKSDAKIVGFEKPIGGHLHTSAHNAFFSALNFNIVFLAEVTDDLWGKHFGFGMDTLGAKVGYIGVQPAAEGVPSDTRRGG